MKYENVTITGIGSYLPPKVVTNADIVKDVDTTDEWIYTKLGIRERRVADNESVSEMGTKAARKALLDANLDKEDIDLIIVATSSPEQISPATACAIHRKLGIKKNVPSYDINAVCSGFLYAISLSAPLVSVGAYKNVLIIATEAYSNITNWKARHCVFFGDGAGAVVLGPAEKGWMGGTIVANGSGTGPTGFVARLDEPFEMVGKEVWDQAAAVLPDSIREVLNSYSLKAEDITMLVPHQPSINILKLVAKEVGLPMEKVKTVMHKYANIAAASIPIALDEAIKKREINWGDKILLTAIGSGWAWGTMVVNYER